MELPADGEEHGPGVCLPSEGPYGQERPCHVVHHVGELDQGPHELDAYCQGRGHCGPEAYGRQAVDHADSPPGGPAAAGSSLELELRRDRKAGNGSELGLSHRAAEARRAPTLQRDRKKPRGRGAQREEHGGGIAGGVDWYSGTRARSQSVDSLREFFAREHTGGEPGAAGVRLTPEGGVGRKGKLQTVPAPKAEGGEKCVLFEAQDMLRDRAGGELCVESSSRAEPNRAFVGEDDGTAAWIRTEQYLQDIQAATEVVVPHVTAAGPTHWLNILVVGVPGPPASPRLLCRSSMSPNFLISLIGS